MTWHAVDGSGRDLATGRPPDRPGAPTPATALAAAPVVSWPLAVADGDGRRLGLAQALGPGGDGVERLLDALVAEPARAAGALDVEALARDTPAGPVPLPLAVVGLQRAVAAASRVAAAFLADVERRRAALRRTLVAAGREGELEAALHVAVLVATDRLDPADDADVDAHVASGARLWLLTGAVVSALAGARPDPFDSWARLVAAGWWPVGPSEGRLVVSDAAGAQRPAE